MNIKIVILSVVLVLTSGCASKQYQLGTDPQAANACGQSVDVAIEGNVNVEATAEDCREIKASAKDGNSGSDLLLQIVGYVAGFAIGMALF